MPKCLECGCIMPRLQWTHFKYKCTGGISSIDEYKNKYPNSILIDEELAAKCKITKQTMIQKYGQELGTQKWEHYRSKQAETNSFEYKNKKYGWSKEQFDDYNKSRSVTLENCVKRHGVQGVEIWNSYIERQRYTNTLEYFIEKYGSEGKEKWLNYNEEKSKSSNVDWIKEKFSVDDDAAIEILSQRRTPSICSKSEKHFVNAFQTALGSEIKYTSFTKQFSIWDKANHRIYFYDITCSSKKKIIEFNGDYWHCNPLMYSGDFIHKHSNLTAKEIWSYDFEKIKTALNRDFSVKIVWESDYINKPDGIIQECVQWWNTN